MALKLINGSVNGDVFFDFLRGNLIPCADPKSVLILRQAGIVAL